MTALDLLRHPRREVGRLLDRRVPATGLALFRIAYCLVLFGEIVQLFYERRLVVDDLPYPDEYLAPVLLAGMLAALALAAGCFTRIAAVVNYLFTLLTFSIFTHYEYHFDYVMTGTSFLMMFMPVEAALSADRWRARRRGDVPAAGVSVLNYHVPLLLCVGTVYLDSIFHKVTSRMWMHGLGVWLPASSPQASWLDLSVLLNQKSLMLFLGYLTFAFEIAFLFLFFRRRFRWPLVVVGTGLHLGILVAFPIPFFALGMITFYFLLVPHGFWRRWFPESVADRAPAAGRGWRVNALLLFFAVAGFLQLTATYRAPFFEPAWEKLARSAPGRAWHRVVGLAAKPARTFLGITPHNVFMDFHFDGYEHLVALVHEAADGGETWLPILDRRGQVAFPRWGRMWVHWTFRANGPHFVRARLVRGVCDVTAVWAERRGVDLERADFRLLAKRIAPREGWRRDALRRDLARPWVDAGRVEWRGGECRVEVGDLEELGQRPAEL